MHLGTGPHVTCHGKGRKERATPLLANTVAVLRVWMREQRGRASDPLFPTRHGNPLGADAVQWMIAKHARPAADTTPSLGAKRISPTT
jgi:site-specific recombinase XerC